MKARGTFVERDFDVQPGPAPRFGRAAAPVAPAPRIGDHTEPVLRKLGIDDEARSRLVSEGVIGRRPLRTMGLLGCENDLRWTRLGLAHCQPGMPAPAICGIVWFPEG